MNKIKKLYIVSAISVSVFAIVFCVLLLNFTKTSYAIDTGTFTNGFPNSPFRSNLTSTDSVVNYVSDAFSSIPDNSYANYLDNFKVPINYSDSNNTNPLYTLMKIIETPKNSETFDTSSSEVKTINDKGITYIINHGYNTTNSVNTIFTKTSHGNVSDNSVKQYITQIALWLYIFENKSSYSSTYCSDSIHDVKACDFVDNTYSVMDATTIRTMITRASEASGFEYLSYILELVDAAKAYTGPQESAIGAFDGNFSYSVTNDNSAVYVYNLLPSITGNSNNYMYYAIEVLDPNNYGVYITDKDDNRLTNTSQMSGAFSIVVPISNDVTTMDLSSITIKVYAYFVVDTNKTYVVTSSTDTALPNTTSNLVIKYGDNKYNRYSDITLGYSPYQVIGTQFNLRNFTKISKVDITDSSELPGATLVVKDKTDESKTWTWVSESTPHYLFLENGNYSLCETIAPSGYERKTECIDFTVESGKVTTVTMENTPINVPDTGAKKNLLIIIFGIILVIFGVGIVSFFAYKKRIVNAQ